LRNGKFVPKFLVSMYCFSISVLLFVARLKHSEYSDLGEYIPDDSDTNNKQPSIGLVTLLLVVSVTCNPFLTERHVCVP